MIQKIAVLSSLVLSASCMVVHQASFPNLQDYYYDANPNYNFAYEVNNAPTGDVKSQHEIRRGSSVLGQYSLIQPDGIQRTVDYSADDHSGFRATVNNQGRQTNGHSPNINVANVYAANVHAANVHAANVYTTNVQTANVHAPNVHTSNVHLSNVHTSNVQPANVHGSYVMPATAHARNMHPTNVQAINVHAENLQAGNLKSQNLHAANIQAGNSQYANILTANAYPNNVNSNGVVRHANLAELRNMRPIQVIQAWPSFSGRSQTPTASTPMAVSRTSFVQTISHGLPPRPRNEHSLWV